MSEATTQTAGISVTYSGSGDTYQVIVGRLA